VHAAIRHHRNGRTVRQFELYVRVPAMTFSEFPKATAPRFQIGERPRESIVADCSHRNPAERLVETMTGFVLILQLEDELVEAVDVFSRMRLLDEPGVYRVVICHFCFSPQLFVIAAEFSL
jgi:hypothetical protein